MKQRDLSDQMAMALVGAGFIASWTYAFMHPSDMVYGICVGATGAFVAAYHMICVHDDKHPDEK